MIGDSSSASEAAPSGRVWRREAVEKWAQATGREDGTMADDDKPPSSRMNADELLAQALLCPDCGAQGIRAGTFTLPSAPSVIMVYIKGLNLEECEGCRKVLAAQGGVPFGGIEDAP